MICDLCWGADPTFLGIWQTGDFPNSLGYLPFGKPGLFGNSFGLRHPQIDFPVSPDKLPVLNKDPYDFAKMPSFRAWQFENLSLTLGMDPLPLFRAWDLQPTPRKSPVSLAGRGERPRPATDKPRADPRPAYPRFCWVIV
jgi:hypothetical protein